MREVNFVPYYNEIFKKYIIQTDIDYLTEYLFTLKYSGYFQVMEILKLGIVISNTFFFRLKLIWNILLQKN